MDRCPTPVRNYACYKYRRRIRGYSIYVKVILFSTRTALDCSTYETDVACWAIWVFESSVPFCFQIENNFDNHCAIPTLRGVACASPQFKMKPVSSVFIEDPKAEHVVCPISLPGEEQDPAFQSLTQVALLHCRHSSLPSSNTPVLYIPLILKSSFVIPICMANLCLPTM